MSDQKVLDETVQGALETSSVSTSSDSTVILDLENPNQSISCDSAILGTTLDLNDLDETGVLNQSLNVDNIYNCSLCKSLADYRRTSYICVDCLHLGTINRICDFCVHIDALQGTAYAYPEWTTEGTIEVIVKQLHKAPGETTPTYHKLCCLPK